jgi:hypothetical protein
MRGKSVRTSIWSGMGENESAPDVESEAQSER